MKRALLLLALGVAAVACGSRGDPLPPLRPLPPPVPDLRIAQRGTEAVIRFGQLPPVVNVEGAEVRLDRYELLLITERYPVIAPEVLASALERERRERLQAAREAAERAERVLERDREALEAREREAAGEEAEEVLEEEPEGEAAEEEEGLTPEELLLRRVPVDAREAWREAGIRGELLLESARKLERAVDVLWARLGLPAAIVDLRSPPELPDPEVIIEVATEVAQEIDYEGGYDTVSGTGAAPAMGTEPVLPGETMSPEVEYFLAEAPVVGEILVDEAKGHLVDNRLQMTHRLTIPPAEGLRTRYLFAVRAVAEDSRPGRIAALVGLAPIPVPAPPRNVTPEVRVEGVELAWDPPLANIRGDFLDQDNLRYAVYRRLENQPVFPHTPLNEAPLEDTRYLDTGVEWGQRYVYDVRARFAQRQRQQLDSRQRVSVAPPLVPQTQLGEQPLKESPTAPTGAVSAEDLYPPEPPRQLEAVRAGRTVTLRWQHSVTSPIEGYRVYRHRAPAPEIPGLPEEEEDEETTAGTEGIPEADAEAEVEAGEELSEETAEEAAGEDVTGAAAETEAGEEATEEEAGEEEATEEEAAEEEQAGEAQPPRDEEAAALQEAEQQAAREDEIRRSRRRNQLLAAGWELLTPIPVEEDSYIDPSVDPAVEWVYVVEAVDEAGNPSTPVKVVVPGPATEEDDEQDDSGSRSRGE